MYNHFKMEFIIYCRSIMSILKPDWHCEEGVGATHNPSPQHNKTVLLIKFPLRVVF